MARAGLEPGTVGLRVRRADHSATLPPQCSLLGSLLGEQEQRHSAGTHIKLIIIMVDAIYYES